MFEKIIKLLNNANNISIYSHVNTDCDAMGSSLALKLALQQMGKKVDVYSNSDFPSNFKFYGKHIDELNQKTCEKYDLAVCLDTPNEGRLGKYKFTYRKGLKNVIVIEDNIINGGVCSAIKDLISKEKNINAKYFAYPDEFIKHGNTLEIEQEYKLSAEEIAKLI